MRRGWLAVVLLCGCSGHCELSFQKKPGDSTPVIRVRELDRREEKQPDGGTIVIYTVAPDGD